MPQETIPANTAHETSNTSTNPNSISNIPSIISDKDSRGGMVVSNLFNFSKGNEGFFANNGSTIWVDNVEDGNLACRSDRAVSTPGVLKNVILASEKKHRLQVTGVAQVGVDAYLFVRHKNRTSDIVWNTVKLPINSKGTVEVEFVVPPLDSNPLVECQVGVLFANPKIGQQFWLYSVAIGTKDFNEQLRVSAGSGDNEKLLDCLREGANINGLDKNLNSALHLAAHYGKTETVKLLCTQEGININIKGHGNNTPLHDAARAGHLEAVRALTDNGADPRLLNVAHQSVRTVAAHQSITDHIDTVIRHINAGIFNVPKRAVDISLELIQAVKEGDLEKVQELLSKGTDIDLVDTDKVTLLHHAAWHNRPAIVEYLLQAGLNIDNNTNTWGSTPLFWAASNNALDAARVLVEQGANINFRVGFNGQDGRTPLEVAVENDHQTMVSFLSEIAISRDTEEHLLQEDISIDEAATYAPFVFLLAQDAKFNIHKILTKEEVYEIIRHNTKSMIEARRITHRDLGNAIGRKESIIADFVTGRYKQADTHLFYNLAKCAGVDIDKFISVKLQPADIAPTLPTSFKASSPKEIWTNYVKNTFHYMESVNLSLEEFEQRHGHIKRSPLGGLNLFDMHQTAKIRKSDLHTLLSPSVTQLSHTQLEPQWTTPAFEITENPRSAPKVLVTKSFQEQMQLDDMRQKVALLLNKRNLMPETIAKATDRELHSVLNFLNGTNKAPHARLIYDITSFFGYDIHEIMQHSPQELLEHSPRESKFSKKISKNILTNYRENLEFIEKELGITRGQLSEKLGYHIPESKLGNLNFFTVQKLANCGNCDVQSIITETLESNKALSKKIIKNFSKILTTVGAISLLSIVPAVAYTSVEIASTELNAHEKYLLNSLLPEDHPVNVLGQLGISTVQMVFDLILTYGKTLDGALFGGLERRRERLERDITEDRGFWNRLLSPPFLDNLWGAVDGYMEGAKPFGKHSQEWFEALTTLATKCAESIYEGTKSLSYMNEIHLQALMEQSKIETVELTAQVLKLSQQDKKIFSEKMEQCPAVTSTASVMRQLTMRPSGTPIQISNKTAEQRLNEHAKAVSAALKKEQEARLAEIHRLRTERDKKKAAADAKQQQPSIVVGANFFVQGSVGGNSPRQVANNMGEKVSSDIKALPNDAKKVVKAVVTPVRKLGKKFKKLKF